MPCLHTARTALTVLLHLSAFGESAALGSSSLDHHGRQLQTGIDLLVPPTGSLAAVSGTVYGSLPLTPADYQLCLYVESITSGAVQVNGPKAVATLTAEGSFTFPLWGNDPVYDPSVPTFHALVALTGTCTPAQAAPALPMLASLLASVTVTRLNVRRTRLMPSLPLPACLFVCLLAYAFHSPPPPPPLPPTTSRPWR